MKPFFLQTRAGNMKPCLHYSRWSVSPIGAALKEEIAECYVHTLYFFLRKAHTCWHVAKHSNKRAGSMKSQISVESGPHNEERFRSCVDCSYEPNSPKWCQSGKSSLQGPTWESSGRSRQGYFSIDYQGCNFTKVFQEKSNASVRHFFTMGG